MKKSNIGIYIGVFLVLAIVGLLLFYSESVEQKYDWSEDLIYNSNEPYGTKIFTDLLKDYFPTSEFEIVGPDMGRLLTDRIGEHKNYFYVGSPPEYTDSLLNLLKLFVAAGNDAFIAINEIPQNFSEQVILQQLFSTPLYDSLYYIDANGDSTLSVQARYDIDESAVGDYRSSSTILNFKDAPFRTTDGYTFNVWEKEELRDRNWNYFNAWFLKQVPEFTPIGTSRQQDQINMIQIPYGEGYFYIHLEPIVFSNYFQIQEDKLEYTSKVLSYLKPGDIYFDLNSNIPPQQQDETEGPLKYILSQRSLRMAWYTLLASLFLFLVFRSKRVQQPIPVLEKNENKSLDFVQTIGRMYFLKQNHKQLLQQKMKLFLHFVQERYRIPVHQTDELFIEKLHMKSEISEGHINTLFNRYYFITKSVNVSADELIEIHKLMDYFYKHCK